MSAPELNSWWTLPADVVRDLYKPHHPGLFLDRCLPLEGSTSEGSTSEEEASKDKPNRVNLFRSTVGALTPSSPAVLAYKPRYERWRAALSAEGPLRAVAVLELETTSRMLLHPGSNTSVTDATLLLHHTYGVPYLPGSGLKGVARAMARRRGLDADLHALFGPERDDEEHRGALVNFLDALWIPGSPSGQSPLDLDVVTPHHSDYYTGDQPPADWQQPVPTSRLVVAPGARFCVILEGCYAPREHVQEWIALAEDLLVKGLEELGFGAWTSAGYGRMKGPEQRAQLSSTPRRSWSDASVALDRGSGRLTATLPDGKRAVVTGAEANLLREGLPENLRASLRAGKLVRVRVETEPEGLALKITAMKAG